MANMSHRCPSLLESPHSLLFPPVAPELTGLGHPTESLSLGGLRGREPVPELKLLRPSRLPGQARFSRSLIPGPGAVQTSGPGRKGSLPSRQLLSLVPLLQLLLPAHCPSGVGGTPGLELKEKTQLMGWLSHPRAGACISEWNPRALPLPEKSSRQPSGPQQDCHLIPRPRKCY